MMLRSSLVVSAALLSFALGCTPTADRSDAAAAKTEIHSGPVRRQVANDPGAVGAGTPLKAKDGHELAEFAGGCFWGVEDNFRQVPGVTATAVGYTGGKTQNPTYETVCTHTTGHAETVLVEYDPAKVTYDDLLRIFFMNHDPTTPNRQGPDVGTNYRSAVYTFSDAQATAAKAFATKVSASMGRPVTTEIAPVAQFWKAEEYHQQYDEKTGTHSCPMPKGVVAQGT